MVTRVCAQRAGRGKPAAVSDKKRQAESTCGKRVIFSSLAISSGSVAMLCPRQAGRQSKDDAKTKRENSCRHNFSQTKCHAYFRRGATKGRQFNLLGKMRRDCLGNAGCFGLPAST